jgi:hypothetical protein
MNNRKKPNSVKYEVKGRELNGIEKESLEHLFNR